MYRLYHSLLHPLVLAHLPFVRFNAPLTELVSDLLTYRPDDQELKVCLETFGIVEDVWTRPGNQHYVNYRPVRWEMGCAPLPGMEVFNPIPPAQPTLPQSIPPEQSMVPFDRLITDRPNVHDLNELCKNLAVGWIHRFRSRRIIAARLYELLSLMENAYGRFSEVRVLGGAWRIALAQIANWSTLDYDQEYDEDMGRLYLAIEAIADPEVDIQEKQENEQ